MLLKIAVLGSILIVGGIIFSSQIQEIFPNTSTDGVNSLKSDVDSLTSKSIIKAEEKIESSIDKAEEKLTEFGHQTIQSTEDKIESSVKKAENKISEIHQDSTEYIEENITEKIFTSNSTK
ncbi:MAG: hypothetical protein H2B00_01590 [Nitrosopumilaceae archaeon]|jgi:F0F1-type ATP synthase membrane subunit b/b'|uniref:Uncharacterized protein n=1 Tax=Candidatus Nitrosomaritimum aestuariumsis TaxID=3342354 RepID=A0AC60VW52_9ARCH|nr:hypothetical protein [Nitrosopumilaceae archaeon]MBA4460490.1 hypothetical protein [Nitrosopumilaceae archaeon]MBA4461187.1 hypothetical protein [Nitrosopumilaceae archaeon]NCF21560.1 hypothetical protein [Nitrosopumilaceae archaeon]